MGKIVVVKLLLTITILIIITVAIITVRFGVYLLEKLSIAIYLAKIAPSNKPSEFLETINVAPISTIFVGSFIIVLGLVGLYGVLRENKQCLLIYTVFVVALCALEIKFILLIQAKVAELLVKAEQIAASIWEGVFNELKDECNRRYNWNSELLQDDHRNVIVKSLCDFVSSEYPEKIYDMLPVVLHYFKTDQKIMDFFHSKTILLRYIGYSLAFIEVMSFTLAICLLNIL